MLLILLPKSAPQWLGVLKKIWFELACIFCVISHLLLTHVLEMTRCTSVHYFRFIQTWSHLVQCVYSNHMIGSFSEHIGNDLDMGVWFSFPIHHSWLGFFSFSVTYPPKIIRDPQHKEIAYKVTGPTTGSTVDPVTLPCVAQGDPQPT